LAQKSVILKAPGGYNFLEVVRWFAKRWATQSTGVEVIYRVKIGDWYDQFHGMGGTFYVSTHPMMLFF